MSQATGLEAIAAAYQLRASLAFWVQFSMVFLRDSPSKPVREVPEAVYRDGLAAACDHKQVSRHEDGPPSLHAQVLDVGAGTAPCKPVMEDAGFNYTAQDRAQTELGGELTCCLQSPPRLARLKH